MLASSIGLKIPHTVVVPDSGNVINAPAEYHVPDSLQFSFHPTNVCPGLVGSHSPTEVEALGAPVWSRSAHSLPPFSSKVIELSCGTVVAVGATVVVVVGATVVVVVGATVVDVVLVVGGGGGGGTMVTTAQLIPSFEFVASEESKAMAP